VKTDEQRREQVRDAMLIDMARALQVLLSAEHGIQQHAEGMTIVGRLESHIQILRESQK
jgi:hypothetical protein